MRLSVILRAPTRQGSAIVSALRTLMRGTRLEPGCTDCQVWSHSEDDDPSRVQVHYEERWVTEAAMAKRVGSDAFTKVLELMEAAVETPQVDFDFLSKHQGLEYVEEIRRGRR